MTHPIPNSISSMEMESSNKLLKCERNWVELPRDVALAILKKLDLSEILKSAQFVCKPWYNHCKDPSLWRTICIHDLKEPEIDYYHRYFNKDVDDMSADGTDDNDKSNDCMMFKSALDRSDGGLIDLEIQGYCPNTLFSYAISRSSGLKRLRVTRWHQISTTTMTEALNTLNSLEELEFTLCSFSGSSNCIISSIPCFPSLATFKFNRVGAGTFYGTYDADALAIAKTMPQLRHLQLLANHLTNQALTQILHHCPHLQSLDLRACPCLDLTGNNDDLGKRLLQNIKDLRSPDDSLDDYKYKDDIMARDDSSDDGGCCMCCMLNDD